MHDLVKILHRGAASADTLGAELELLVVDPATGRPATAHEIQRAIEGCDPPVSFEAPGQIEVRTPPARSLDALAATLADAVERAIALLSDAGLAGLTLGFQPFSSLQSRDGNDLVVASADELVLSSAAAVHINISYRDEEDARRKLVVGRALAPELVALFGGSPMVRGKALTASFRAMIWTSAFVDYRVPDTVLAPSPGTFDRYIDWLAKRSVEDGSDPIDRLRIPTADVRLKTSLVEIRSFDSLPVVGAIAAAAMVRGLLSDPSNLARLAADPPHSTARWSAIARAAHLGLSDDAMVTQLENLVAMAASGLERLGEDPSHLTWARQALAVRLNWGQRVARLRETSVSPRELIASLTAAMADRRQGTFVSATATDAPASVETSRSMGK
jgi:gamma-glutamylcysteine synthetase